MNWKILLLVLVFSSCSNDEALIGHWHCKPLNNSNSIFTIDFYWGDSVVFNLNAIDGPYYSRWEKSQSFIPGAGECGVLNLKYRLKDDSLFLVQTGLGGKFVATKCEQACCDLQSDFFMPTDMEIDLPVINCLNCKSFEFDRQRRTYNFLFTGKSNSSNCFPSHRLNLGYRFATLHDIPLWLESEKLRRHENLRKLNRCVLFLDKSTPDDLVHSILHKLKSSQETVVLLAGRLNTNTKDSFELRMIPFKLNTLDTINSLSYQKMINTRFE